MVYFVYNEATGGKTCNERAEFYYSSERKTAREDVVAANKLSPQVDLKKILTFLSKPKWSK